MPNNPLQGLLDKYQSNAYPAMQEDLASHLGVSYESVRRIAPGWAPIVTFKKGPNFQGWWTIPERDDTGTLIGLGLRSRSDYKAMHPGSKRGLIYEINPDHSLGERGYSPGRHNWVRLCDCGLPCPVCGRPDGCLLSAENPSDPKAVICARNPSPVPRGIGWLHILKPEGDIHGKAVLIPSELPVLVVEGFSDTCVALDLGFVCVGRPSDQAGMLLLTALLRGRDCLVVGENDKKDDGREPGREGMIAAFQNLSHVAKSVRMVMPPSHVKDLRDWRKKDQIDQAGLLSYVAQHGQSREDSPVIQDERPSTIAVAFLDSEYRQTGRYLLRQWEGTWYRYGDGKYEALSANEVKQPMYLWAKNKLLSRTKPNGELKVEPLMMNLTMVNNLEQAMMAETLLPLATLPCWVNGADGPDPKDLIVFNNGILDVPAYLADRSDYLLPHTPDLFATVALPFAFDPTATCPNWLRFITSSLGDEPAKIELLREWIGLCMTSDTSYQKMMYFRGLSGSGKGTTLRVMHELIGKGQGVATTFSDLAGDFGLKPLLGKLICTIADARSPSSGKHARGLEILLNMTGEDNVQVNRKNKDQLDDVMLICRVTIASNSFIEVPDHEGAMARRLLVIEWKRSFQENPDINLSSKLREELPGIALWALGGLRNLRQRGEFTSPESMKKAIAEWRTSNSPMRAFIEECCDQSGEVSKDRLYDVWEAWANERHVSLMSRGRFFERLRANLHHLDAGDKVYRGVSLQRWAEKKY